MLSFLFSSSQDKQLSPEFQYPQFALVTSLTSFSDYDAGMMMGLNYRWTEKFSFSLEPTWVFFSAFESGNKELNGPSGVRVRADFRFHLTNRRKRNPDFFIGPEFHYKYVTRQKDAVFGINCQNGQCAYFQNAAYTEVKNELGGFVKAGLLLPLSFIDKRDCFVVEIYGGIGAKRLKYREIDLPVGGSFLNLPNRDIFDFGNSNNRNIVSRPIIPAGMKFIYILK